MVFMKPKPKAATGPRLIVGQPMAGTGWLGEDFPTPANLKLRALQARLRSGKKAGAKPKGKKG
jgi:hypothetical protein